MRWFHSIALFFVLPAVPAPSCTLLVAAAADLTVLQAQLGSALPGCKITLSFGSSGTLARQIRNGADFDVYLAASQTYVDELIAAGAADAASALPYARGRLGVWSAKRLKWRDLTSPSTTRIAIANPAHAPYGRAAREALEKQGIWAAVEKKIVYGENVRQAWQFAVTGNADAVVAAWGLMHDRGGQLLPESWHNPIVQVAVVPKSAQHPQDARRFLAWLVSPAGRKLFADHGFEPVPEVR